MNILLNIASETFRLFFEMSPYLILGFFFSGLLHIVIGEKYIKKHFSKGGIIASVKAALFGIPLPVCSCGVIPLAESMNRDGASKSSTMAFLVSTPSSGVDSIFATYALLGPVYAVFRPVASFISGVLVGIFTHFKEKNGETSPEPYQKNNIKNSNPKPKKSFKDAFLYGFKVIPSEIATWLIIGIFIGGIISTLVPTDFGTKYLQSPFLNYFMVLLISIPLYVCATGSIPIAASLIAKGVLPGAALAFLIAGPATNTVTISFVYKRMGKKIAFLYIFLIITISLSFGLFFDLLVKQSNLNFGFVSLGGSFLPHTFKIISGIILGIIFLYSKLDLGKFKMNKIKNVYSINVPDMTCQHCKIKIGNAISNLQEIVSYDIDLKSKQIKIESEIDKQVIIKLIKNEGYHPEQI